MALQFIASHPSIFIIATTYLIMGIIFLYWKKVPTDDEIYDLPDGGVILNPSFVGNTDNNENRYVSTVHSYNFRRNNEISNQTSSTSNTGRYTSRNPDEVDYANAEYFKENRDKKDWNKKEPEYANLVCARDR